MDLTHEEKARVGHEARLINPERFQPTSNLNTQRLNRIESTLIELGYSPEAMVEIHERQGKAIFERNVADGTRRLLEQKANYAEFSIKSFEIFMDAFAPFLGEKRLNWDTRITDDMTGKKSPTLESLLKSSLPAIVDAIAVNDANAFKSQITSKYADFPLDYRSDRWEQEGKAKYPLNRYFTVTIRLRVVKR